MNRSELVAAVAQHTGHSQAAVNGVVDAIFTVVSKEVAKGNKVTIPGWVSFDRTTPCSSSGPQPSDRCDDSDCRIQERQGFRW
jgi:DNA-binding protein HU-beta